MNDDKETSEQQKKQEAEKKPNENAGFYFSSSLRITDPETGQVLLQTRCD